MSERGLPIAEGAAACPFVAFEDDRDERATVPDHRHRCYAEVRPAPRALAHQEAYCLSSAFPVCPTFQDWARREAARARDVAAGVAAAAAASAAAAQPPPPADDAGPGVMAEPTPARSSAPIPDETDVPPAADAGDLDVPDPSTHDDEHAAGDRSDGPRRNPPRDWSAPPPWLASAEASPGIPTDPPDFLAGRSDPARGLAGSAADLLAGGPPPRAPQASYPLAATPPPPPVDAWRADGPADTGEPDFEARDLPRPAPPARRPRAYDQHLGGPTSGPDWERPRRYEAYPTIKARMGMPAIPRLAGLAAAVAVAAIAVFLLGPPLLGIGTTDEPTASRSPSPSPSRSIAPTPSAAATPVVYIIKRGDTLSKIAVANGLTIEQLLAANPDIKDPNKIVVGNSIIIPPPPSEVPEEFGGSAAPSAGP